MPDLVIAPLLGVLCRSIQRLRQVLLGNGFYILTSGESVTLKTLTVIARQSIRISNQPSLYGLHHQMTVLLGDLPEIPSISNPKMFPGSVNYRRFRVYKQDEESIRVRSPRRPKAVEGCIPTAARRDGPAKPTVPGKLPERL